MKLRSVLLALLAVGAIGGTGALLYAWESSIDPIDPRSAGATDTVMVRRGASLALLGDCATCHTASGGAPYAGGLAMPAPFGTIYSTNITPDPETGIGRWCEQAFVRALRSGVDREGRHLYPAFPYDHFMRVADDDAKAHVCLPDVARSGQIVGAAKRTSVSAQYSPDARRLEAAV